MNNNKRQAGYYRVKYDGQWTIGKYDSYYESFDIPETCYSYSDEELDQIDETPINPEPENKTI